MTAGPGRPGSWSSRWLPASSLVLASFAAGATACEDAESRPPGDDRAAAYRAALGTPNGLELPAFPASNPPTPEKRELGRRLFHDKRLSGNQTQSCSSCHVQALAFTDAKKTPVGSTGAPLKRNSQGLLNAAYHSTLTWANNGLVLLEAQIPVPIRGDNPVELGVSDANVAEVLARFDGHPGYQEAFARAFPDSTSGATVDKVVFALATFIRSLASNESPYDRYLRGDSNALSASAKRGEALFNGERLECFHCHNGVNLTSSYRDARTTEGTAKYPFFNNGLYDVDGTGSYPPYDQGLFEVTQNPNDRGKFRPQSLRNVSRTAPYMHDGSIATLEGVVRHYAAGGRNVETGPWAGDGRKSPLKSGLVRGVAITDDEVADVVAFLEALTDEEALTAERFSDPGDF